MVSVKSRLLIYLPLALAFLIIVVLGYFTTTYNQKLISYSNKIEHTYSVLKTIKVLEKLMLDGETAQRGYLLTREQSFKRPYDQFLQTIDSVVTSLDSLTKDNAVQRVEIQFLRNTVNSRKMFLDSAFLLKPNKKNLVTLLERSKLQMDKFMFYAQEMENEELLALQSNRQGKSRMQEITPQLLHVSSVFALFVCLLSVGLTGWQLKKRLSYQSDLEKSMLELKTSKEEIEQMAFAVSHNLQEPLRKIRVFSNLLVNKYHDKLSPEDGHILERIDSGTVVMQNLLQDLIHFTNLINNNEPLGPVDLNKVIIDSFNLIAEGKENYKWQFDHDLPPVIGHAEQLNILFINLFDNAFKYRKKETALVIFISHLLVPETELPVKTDMIRKQQYLQISISDNGIGIDKEFAEKIFAIFQRLHQTEEYEGKGIGLAMAKRVMTNHYGYITATGINGHGCTITLYFPFNA